MESSIKSVARNSGRAIANSAALIGIKVGDSMLISKEKINGKEIGLDAAIMAGSSLMTSTVNSLINTIVTVPAWLKTFEYTYGVDFVTLIIYVVVVKLVDMKLNYKSSFVKTILEAVAALVAGGYLVAPINNMLPLSLKA